MRMRMSRWLWTVVPALAVLAHPAPGQVAYCPADTSGDDVVDVQDLILIVLGWGACHVSPCPGDVNGDEVVDVDDLVEAILGWGPCPAPPNDECAAATPVLVVEPQGTLGVPLDARGATASAEPSLCLPAALDDVWFTIENATILALELVVAPTIDLFLEVAEGEGCPPAELISCGLDQGVVLTVVPGDVVSIRLLNMLDLPADDLVGLLTIAVAPVPTPGPVGFFVEEPLAFLEAVHARDLVEQFDWSFEPDLLDPPQAQEICDGLDQITHPTLAPGVWSDPDGTDLWPAAVDDVTFTASTVPSGPIVPRGLDGLFYRKPDGEALLVSTLTANFFDDSFNVLTGAPAGGPLSALAIEVIVNPGFNLPPSQFRIRVYDAALEFIGQINVFGIPHGQPVMVGILADPGTEIGRVEVHDLEGGPEGVASIAGYD